MLAAIGMEAFAERARRELLATGEKVAQAHASTTRDELTAAGGADRPARRATACPTRRSAPGCSSAPAPSSGTCARCSPSSGSAPARPSTTPCRAMSRSQRPRSGQPAVRYGPRMRAAVHTRYGPPEVVRIAEVDKPAAGDNDVLVRVHATTVNRTDCACRAAKPFFMRLFTGLLRPRATVLGNEFAGVVEAVGSGVTSLRGRRQGVRLQRGPVRRARRVPVDPAGRLARDHAGEPDLRSRPLRVPRVRTTPSRTSGRQGSRAGRTSWSTARPEPSARRRSSC